jgi:phage-related protein
MATFTAIPDNGCSYEVKPNVRVANYGDGYEQRQTTGINAMPKKWNLKFSVRTDSEASYITSFLTTQASVQSFDWTDPYGYAGKYVCRSWSSTKDRYNLNTVVAVFEQVFEL